MMFMRIVTVTVLLVLGSVRLEANDAVAEMAESAQAFIETLEPAQKEKATFELKDEERFNWNFVPKDRKGLPFKDMSKKQKDAAYALLDSVLSQRGFIDATTIVSLENVLHELENKNPRRDPSLYYFSFFGQPTNPDWAWRFEGHHLSMNFAISGKNVSVTPTFWGSNPAEVKEGDKKGKRTLATEEDMGRQLIQLLDEDQRKIAIFSETAPKEIITGNERKAKTLEPKGIPFAQMNREQGELLLKLVRHYLDRYRSEVAEMDWKRIREAHFESIYFAWAGGTERGQGHYYRVQGPTFLLEYDNTQNNANHVHTSWRDFENDFGESLLQKHYREVPHGSDKKP